MSTTTNNIVTRLEDIPTLADEYAQSPDSSTILSDHRLAGALSIWRGDITKLEVDFIVTHTDHELSGSQGIDKIIHEAAGPAMTRACQTLGKVGEGETKVTIGYKLRPFGMVREDLLGACFRVPLESCEDYGQRSIAFPCLSYSPQPEVDELAARVAIMTIRKFLENNRRSLEKLDRVVLVPSTEKEAELYTSLVRHYFPAAPRRAVRASPQTGDGVNGGGEAKEGDEGPRV